MGNLLGWESRTDESGFRQLGLDFKDLTKEFCFCFFVCLFVCLFVSLMVVFEWIQSDLLSTKSFYQHVEDGTKRKETQGKEAR